MTGRVQGCTGSEGHLDLGSRQELKSAVTVFWLLFGCQLSDSLILGIILCHWECEVTLHQGTAHADLEIKDKAWGHEDGEVSNLSGAVFEVFFPCRIITSLLVSEQPQLRHISQILPIAWSHSDVQNHHCGHLNTGRQYYSWAFNPDAALLDCFISQL